MGTSLYQIGNHKIPFKGREFKELAEEIKKILDNSELPNPEFLRLFALYWDSDNPRKIHEIKTKQFWTYREEADNYNFNNYNQIDFYGPFNLHLTFGEGTISIWNPPYGYRDWIEMDDKIHRDEWRKYMQHIIVLFGGDRVLYAADNGHFLDIYTECYDTFENMENNLIKNYGSPKKTFEEVANDYNNSYIIDDFQSIDWSQNEPLEGYLPEPDDTSSTDYDLEFYSIKDNLKQLKFDDEVLRHRLFDGEIHFYHLARVDGLLCVHTGIVGMQENLEVTLDKYAPFTYSTLKNEIEKEGYGNKCGINYIIKLNGWDSIHSWQDALSEFGTELLWNGIGVNGYYFYRGDERQEWFYAVDEKLAMKLLLDLGKKYNATGIIEVYRNVNNNNEDGEYINETLIYKQ